MQTGCWNRRELDTLGIAMILALDRTEEYYNQIRQKGISCPQQNFNHFRKAGKAPDF
jgi:hypothetical protein